MTLTILSKSFTDTCDLCGQVRECWVCNYDGNANERRPAYKNSQMVCADCMPSEIEYCHRVMCQVIDERELPPYDWREVVAAGAAEARAAVGVRPAPQPAGTTIKHSCHRPGCDIAVAPNFLACRPHWFELLRGAPEIARDLQKFYRAGQEVDKRPSADYMAAFERAQAWWTAKDSRAA